jgi:tryptophan synthase beta chain
MSAIGHFGEYGGRFVPEALIGALEELEAAHIFLLKRIPTFSRTFLNSIKVTQGVPALSPKLRDFLSMQVDLESF